MFYLNIIFALFLSLSYAVITVSPDGTQDFTTIQAAIDSVTVNPADIEIDVYPGTYQENLLIEADMIIRSVGDTSNTIIDGSLGNRSLGSTIVIRPESMTTHHPVVEIDGFSIKNGTGTDIKKEIDTPEGSQTITQKVGGGLFVYVNSPKINNSQFLGNGDNSTDKGGAIFSVSDSDGIDFPDRPDYQDHPDLLPAEGILDFSHNTFLGNDSDYGHSVYILGDDYDEVKMIGDYLDVFSMNYESASEYWVVSDYDIDYTNASGEAESIYTDVWVDPVNGIDEGNIIGDENNPFLTIDYAMSMIYPTTENPITIHLTADPFLSSTENFPIILKSNINLIGQGEGVTILDAGQTDRVITMENCENNILSGLTITGGDRNPGSGGGMVLINSDPLITDIAIQGNSAEDFGGGIYLINSNPTLVNITIDNNDANNGGGIAFNNSSPTMKDAIISNNSAYYSGGGLDIFNLSAPILSQVIIASNSSYSIGGGIYLLGSKAIFDHVLIYDNTAYIGGGLYIVVYGDDTNPIFNHVTISNNSVEGPSESGGIFIDGSICTEDSYCPKIINSIIYNNSGQSSVGNGAVITYSNVSGGYEGIGNINSNPYFNGDFSLQDSSPCIDAGHPNPIYKDLDLSRADMGFTGGSYLLPTFTEYDFGEVGTTVITENWYLYNFRSTNFLINSASFQTQSFYTDVNFPLIIESLDKAIIPINAISLSTGVINDNMVISGPDIPDGSFVDLVMTAVGENVLSGNLSGQLPTATYRIMGNLTVDAGETLYISPGTTFLFDGEYSFTVYGILKAQGNEQDSIIFSNYNLNTPNKWKGITLQNVTEETVLQYVRISGTFSDDWWEGGGIDLWYSDPILANITISGNMSSQGGGIGGWESSPTIIDAVITNNTACNGGGIYLENADGAQLIRSLVANNNVQSQNGCGTNGGGLYITGYTCDCNSLFIINSTISDNVAPGYGDGIYIRYSMPVIINSIIWDNNCNNSNCNISVFDSGDSIYETTIIADNIIGGWNNPSWTSDCSNYSSSENPLFTDSQNGDYSLQENSPCIDAGTAYFECDSEVILNIDSSEYFGLSPDLGAYEYYSSDAVGGCTDSNAANYDPDADYNDGSCVYAWPPEDLTYVITDNGVFLNWLPPSSSSYCGDGICDSDENSSTCPDDCGGGPECGDGSCNGDEDCNSCPDDCGGCGECPDGYIEDCADDDCCPESWIGDGFADCEDQAYGCDLTCYDNDGGDCEGGGGTTGGGSEGCDACAYDFTPYGSECCDTAWDEFGIDCATLESSYNWDCSGCNCPGDSGGTDGGADGGGGCDAGYVDDCSGDGDCCPESWIGDGFADCEDQAYGCDLTCYANDGGDCDERIENNKQLIKDINFNDCQNRKFGDNGFLSKTKCMALLNKVRFINQTVYPKSLIREDISQYNIYRAANGSEFEPIDSTDQDNYLDNGVSAGNTYQYAITAVYEDEQQMYESGYSNIIEVYIEGSTLLGDLNDDGLINVLDVVILVNIVLGYDEPIDAGDLNGDGILNVLDVVMLVNIILNG